MKESQAGSSCPKAIFTWLVANQGIATNANYSPAAVVVPGARAANGVAVANARTQLPRTAGGAEPLVTARISANDQVTLVMTNNNANAVVATAADIVFDILVLPLVP
jgi:hypothetical protein